MERRAGYSARYERCKPYLQEASLDAVVAVSPENVFYMAETYLETQKSLRDRLAMALLPLEAEPVMIGCIIERNTIEQETWIRDKRYYVEFQQSPIELLAEALREKGLERGRVGIELDYLSALYAAELRERLPDLQMVPCVKLFERIRSVKEPEEIRLLARGAQATRRAFELAVEETHVGDTERDLAKRTMKHMIDLGCEKVDFLALGTAERSVLVHAVPGDAPLLDGEEGRIDFGGLFGNYNSDVARTFTIGRVQPKFEDVFSRMAEAFRAAVDACRVGSPVRGPYLAAQRKSMELGLPFDRMHEGHGLGIGCHEFPILEPKNDSLFEENMVVCVEHAVHVDGYRYHVEDLIQLTKDGPVILSDPDWNPRLLHIE